MSEPINKYIFTDRTKPEYKKNPMLHYKKVIEFRDFLRVHQLGVEDPEYRELVGWWLECVNAKIRELQIKLL